MTKPLQPLTRLLILASAVVPAIFAVGQLFLPDLVNSLLWPPPFEPIPAVTLRYLAMAYLALTARGFYAVIQNDSRVGLGYLAFAGPYVVLSLVLSIITAITPPGVPSIAWLYVFLAAIYTVIFVMVWRQESAQYQTA